MKKLNLGHKTIYINEYEWDNVEGVSDETYNRYRSAKEQSKPIEEYL